MIEEGSEFQRMRRVHDENDENNHEKERGDARQASQGAHDSAEGSECDHANAGHPNRHDEQAACDEALSDTDRDLKCPGQLVDETRIP